jgi:glucose/mannose-6-phosphate isomerase
MTMRAAVLDLPDQLRWAADLTPPVVPQRPSVLLCGMGGSAMAGDVAAGIAAAAGVPAIVHRSYGLPAWAASLRPLVVLVSYSGNTEEVLEAATEAAAADLPIALAASGGEMAERAGEAGWPMIAVPGGLQPRAALGFQSGAVLRLLEGGGLVPPQAASLRDAADVAAGLMGNGDGVAATLASDIAAVLDGRITVVYGSHGPAALAARRWKTQINENAKMPAYWGVLPELDHNEIEGWSTLAGVTRRRTGVVFLRESGEHPRVARRADLTAELIADETVVAGTVRAQGDDALGRLFSLVAVGDLVSVAMAERAGVDPTPVERIQELKRRLAEE